MNVVDDCVYHKFSGSKYFSWSSILMTYLKGLAMQDCKSGDSLVAKGDKFNLNQCPKEN